MKKLTKENYFSIANRAITNSRISDWLKCKNYFKRKHIDGTVDFKRTSAMITGSVVDELLTQEEITGNYIVGDKRKKEFKDLENVNVISQLQYDEMIGLASAVEETSAYKELKDYIKQDILQFEGDYGDYFDSIAGIPDFYKIVKTPDGHKCIIVDLKTSQTINPVLYAKHAEGLGYYRQQAFYQILLAKKYPQIDEFESRHIVVEKQRDIYNVGTFVIDQWKIDVEKDEIKRIIEEIKNEKSFKKKDASWDEAVTI